MRAVQCPFCFICLDVSRIGIGKTIRCPACSGPIRVPQPERRAPIRFLLAGIALGLLAGAGLTFAAIRLFPVQTRDFIVSAPANPAEDTPRTEDTEPAADAAPPVAKSMDHRQWKEQVDRLSGTVRRHYGEATIHESRPWLIAVQDGVPDAHRVVQLYERALKSLDERFHQEFADLDLPRFDQPLLVLVLRDRREFRRYWTRNFGRLPPERITAIYLSTRRQSVTYYEESLTFGRLLHEGAHQLADAVSVRSEENLPLKSFWLHEGLGCFFEPYEIFRDGSFTRVTCTAGRNTERWYDFVTAMDDPRLRKLFSLRDLLDMTLGSFDKWHRKLEFNQDLQKKVSDIYYAASWALVYFLVRGPNETYRETLLEYFLMEIRGRSDNVRFDELLKERAQVDLETFEADFMDFIRNN